MRLNRKDLYLVAGLTLIVGALFAAAKAVGGLIALIFFIVSTDFTDIDQSISGNIANTWKAGQTSGMVHGIGSFLILFFGGRWVLRGPKLLDRWIGDSERLAGADSESQDSN